jgi:hypothetical protein
MADLDLARKLLTKLRHVPNPTPAKLLAEFRRLVAAEEVSAQALGADCLTGLVAKRGAR